MYMVKLTGQMTSNTYVHWQAYRSNDVYVHITMIDGTIAELLGNGPSKT